MPLSVTIIMDRVQSLRRYDFPECAKLALDQLANLLVQGNQGIPGLGAANEDVVEQVVSEFIFGLTSVKLRQHRVNFPSFINFSFNLTVNFSDFILQH